MTDTTTTPTPIIDGGPAFAAQGPDRYAFQTGMSLRDWFAGQALAGLMTVSGPIAPAHDAATCYEMADAMIATQFQRR